MLALVRLFALHPALLHQDILPARPAVRWPPEGLPEGVGHRKNVRHEAPVGAKLVDDRQQHLVLRGRPGHGLVPVHSPRAGGVGRLLRLFGRRRGLLLAVLGLHLEERREVLLDLGVLLGALGARGPRLCEEGLLRVVLLQQGGRHAEQVGDLQLGVPKGERHPRVLAVPLGLPLLPLLLILALPALLSLGGLGAWRPRHHAHHLHVVPRLQAVVQAAHSDHAAHPVQLLLLAAPLLLPAEQRHPVLAEHHRAVQQQALVRALLQLLLGLDGGNLDQVAVLVVHGHHVLVQLPLLLRGLAQQAVHVHRVQVQEVLLLLHGELHRAASPLDLLLELHHPHALPVLLFLNFGLRRDLAVVLQSDIVLGEREGVSV